MTDWEIPTQPPGDTCYQCGRRLVSAYDQDDDGLSESWLSETLFLNPPYGDQAGEWVQKLYDEIQAGNVSKAIVLLAARTDTGWFQLLRAYPRCFVSGRIKFWGPNANGNGANFPSVVIAIGCDLVAFYDAFRDIGDVYQWVGVAEEEV